MIERSVLEQILSANGVESSAPAEEIRSVLVSAKWNAEDVDTAITVLHENVETRETRVDSLHKIFRSDQKLKPETISSLLGIEMTVSAPDVVQKRQENRDVSSGQMLQILLISLGLALALVMGAMWFTKVGLFHPTY